MRQFSFCTLILLGALTAAQAAPVAAPSSPLPSVTYPAPLKALVPLPAEPEVPTTHEGYKSIPLHVTEPSGVKRQGHPVRGGIPFPKGELTDFAALRLVDEKGQAIPAQFEVLSRWWDFSKPRGETSSYSIKWLAVSFLIDLDAKQERTLRLEYGSLSAGVGTSVPMAKQTKAGLTVDTDALRATFDPANGLLKQIECRSGDQWKAMLAAPAELFVQVKANPPAAGGLWTTLGKLDGPRSWRFVPDPQDIGEHSGWHTLACDDRSWTWQDPFDPWEKQGFPTHDDAGWYRTHVTALEAWRGRAVYLEMREQHWRSLSDNRKLTVYLNGAQIATVTPNGQVQPVDDIAWKQPRVRLPEDKLRFGQDNVIAVRAFDDGDGVGGLVCTPMIVSPHDAKRDGAYPDASGRYDNSRGGEMAVISPGPQRAVVRVKGWLSRTGNGELSQYTLFYTFHRGSAAMEVSYTFTNTEDPYLVTIQSAGLTLPLAAKGAAAVTMPEYSGPLAANGRVLLHQYHDGEGRYPGYPSLSTTPLKLVYQVRDGSGGGSGGGAKLASGERTLGWAGLGWEGGSAALSMRDFARSYPSELAVSGDGKLTAYMWPADGPAMDLRNWVDRKDSGWAKLEENAKAGNLVAQSVKSLALGNHGTGEALPEENPVGVSWTRRLEFDFSAAPLDPKRQQERAVAFDQPILPFVTAQWNCRTEAAGMPLHPYDPANYPLLEAATDTEQSWLRIMHWDKMPVLGMWYFGAARYNMYLDTIESIDAGAMQVTWSRRWFHEESGQSPEVMPLIQYLRTGYLPHYGFGKAMVDFATDVMYRTWHRAPHCTGYAYAHHLDVFGDHASASHTNLEGIILGYCLNGDEHTRDFLDRLNTQYKREPIEMFTVRGNWLDREHDSPIYTRLALWDLDGEDWQREWVLRGLDFYRRNDLEGFTNQGGATYRIAQTTRMWYRTHDPALLELMAHPMQVFVDGSSAGLLETYAAAATYLLENAPHLRKPMTREEFEKSITPVQGNKMAFAGDYPGLLLAALYKAGLPVLDYKAEDFPLLMKMHSRTKGAQPLTPAAGHRFEPIDMRSAANVDPFAIVDTPTPRWRWLGQYHAYNDQSPPFDPTLGKGQIGVDFGAAQNTAPGWHRGYGRSVYPTFENYECSGNFAGLPFGASVAFDGVPFDLIDPATNKGSGYLRSVKGKTFEIPINRKASHLYFLGHVLNGPEKGNAAALGRYVVRYEDGSTQTTDLRDALHADAWRNNGQLAALTLPVKFVRSWKVEADLGIFLHVNLFPLTTDESKTIKSVALESAVDGFCLLAVSAEVSGEAPKATPDEIVLYDAKRDAAAPPAAFGQPINFALPDGWYDISVQTPQYKTSQVVYGMRDAQVFIEAQHQMAVCGYMARYGSGLTFPAEVASGKLQLVLHVNFAAANQPALERITARRRAGSPGFASPRRAMADLFCYGWKRDPIEQGSAFGEGLTDYPQRDMVTRDCVNASKNTFTLHAPEGYYKLRLMVFAPAGHPGYSVVVNGQRSAAVELPRQRWQFGDDHVCRSYEVIETPVHAAGGKIAIEFPAGTAGLEWGQMIGARGMTLTPTDEGVYKAALASIVAAPPGPTNEKWELRFTETFDNADLSKHWRMMEGSWNVSGGMLTGKGLIMCATPFPGAQRVEYQCRSADPCDLSAVLSADWAGVQTGYMLAFGAENNAFSRLLVAGKEAKRWDTLIVPGKLHEVAVEREGAMVRQWVDGKLVVECKDESPEAPLRHPLIGFYAWNSGQFDNVKVYTRRDP